MHDYEKGLTSTLNHMVHKTIKNYLHNELGITKQEIINKIDNRINPIIDEYLEQYFKKRFEAFVNSCLTEKLLYKYVTDIYLKNNPTFAKITEEVAHLITEQIAITLLEK